MKFPVYSQLAGNLAFSETSSQLTPPSCGESTANLPHTVRQGCLGPEVEARSYSKISIPFFSIPFSGHLSDRIGA